jgi:hypothetical protein
MKKLLIIGALIGLGMTTSAVGKPHGKRHAARQAAMHHEMHGDSNAQGMEIIERDSKGRATKVRREGQEYNVCTSDDADGCINPREAGLGWGNNTAKEWTGREISRDH